MNENSTAQATPPPPPRGRRPVAPKERSPRMVAAAVAVVVLAAGLALYGLAGWAADWLAMHVPTKYERPVGESMASSACSPALAEEAGKLRAVMAPLVSAMGGDNPGYAFEVCAADDETLNAAALPGGWIVVNSGLLRAVESDAEIAFVLAHELGHLRHRHHVRRLGRSLVFHMAIGYVTGRESHISPLLENTETMRFSRSQEREADAYAVELLRRTGGDIRGGIALLERLSRGEAASGFMEYFSTHPDPEKRMERLREALEQ